MSDLALRTTASTTTRCVTTHLHLPRDSSDDYLTSIDEKVAVQAEADKQTTAPFYRKAAVAINGRHARPNVEGSRMSAAGLAFEAGGGVIAAGVCVEVSRKRPCTPALPIFAYVPDHRPKLGHRLPAPACVAEPISRKTQLSNPLAQPAMDAEWDRVRKLGTWDEVVVRDCADVAREARDAGRGHRPGLCFEENS